MTRPRLRPRHECPPYNDGVRPCAEITCRYNLAPERVRGGDPDSQERMADAIADLAAEWGSSCVIDLCKEPRSFDEIGAILGRSDSTIRRVERESLVKMRVAMSQT